MTGTELKILLVLLGYAPDYCAPLSQLKVTARAADRDRACQQLRDRGFLDWQDEITHINIAPPGKALLDLGSDALPITEQEMNVLKACQDERISIGKTRIPIEQRQHLVRNLAYRGLLNIETKVTTVQLTEAGCWFLKDDYWPEDTGDLVLSPTLLGNYLRFLRQGDRAMLKRSSQVL